jgi:uncharacterized membrane protein
MNGGKVSGIALRHDLMVLAKRRQKREDRIADQITAFAGSLQFVYIHVVWFTAWIIINVSPWAFDPFPFGLLTLIVSLEAIFLSTFVMLSQNRESARSDLRAEVDFETNVVSEVWLEALANHLGLDVNQVYATAHDRINQARAQQAQAVAVGSDAGRESPESPGVRPGA